MPTRRETIRRGASVLAVGGLGTLAVAETGSDPRKSADVLVAGSLQSVATNVGEATVEAHGSVACRRLLEDGLRDPDAVALADPALFSGLAKQVTTFATNAVVLVLRPGLADEGSESSTSDWRAVVRDSNLTVGRTDPDRDPLGYRTVMALRLDDAIDAESALSETKLFPETSLLRTLEGGGIDAAFAYRNMAVEHDLPYLELPEEIDFSNPALADHYASASVELSDRTVQGAPIRYGALARTERGKQWVSTVTETRETLQDAGFGVPESYPKSLKI
ncbi:substrate-binding domain-containing protein [Halorussus halophilus]|uniref:substrate-binding domain-containing protein n=1 Tax=Halorussus halophilus TaxID=2650975 RepID=UPI00130195BA|nr:substrate-binding domain-containing protein [Halorussus halophilus]